MDKQYIYLDIHDATHVEKKEIPNPSLVTSEHSIDDHVHSWYKISTFHTESVNYGQVLHVAPCQHNV